MDIMERVEQTAMQIIKELEHHSYGERLRELGLLSLGKRLGFSLASIST